MHIYIYMQCSSMQGLYAQLTGEDLYIYIHIYIYIYMHIYIYIYMHIYIYVCIYVMGMSMDAAGMSIHPFQWNFYVLAGKYLKYSIFDDVIMLHH